MMVVSENLVKISHETACFASCVKSGMVSACFNMVNVFSKLFFDFQEVDHFGTDKIVDFDSIYSNCIIFLKNGKQNERQIYQPTNKYLYFSMVVLILPIIGSSCRTASFTDNFQFRRNFVKKIIMLMAAIKIHRQFEKKKT